jgi:hypothetical protein
VAGASWGKKADFSAALLTKCASSFGRNDGSLKGKKKQATAAAKAKAKCRGFSPR